MENMDNFRERFEALGQQGERLQNTRMVEPRLRRWRAMAYGVVMLLGTIGITLGSVTLAHADDIQCGDVLGPGGRFELEHDLECPRGPAVTVRDGAILDLNGHLVQCGPVTIGCIVLTGVGAQLLNGAVRGALHENIVLEGTGGHTVRNVTSTFVDASIRVPSDNNRLINILADSSFNPAFIITGNHNLLSDNIARCFSMLFSGGCIAVTGNENRLIDNFATATAEAGRGFGFRIIGNNNVLRRNRATSNEHVGIIVTGTGNRLQRNTALENPLDLQDTNGDCAQNTWEQNTFRTSDPACIQ
jgi:parallel beta-helix repeat protein